MAPTQRSGANSGFTLLELMIALALTSMLTLVAYTALSLSLKAMRHGGAAAEQVQELRVAETILARSVSSAASHSMDDELYFVGNAREMRFFTPVPLEAYDMGGIYHWRIMAGHDESGQMVLAVEQARNVNWARDPEGVEIRQILMENLTDLSFTYGRGGQEYENWDAAKVKALPDWVRVYVTQKGQAPMVWFIPLFVTDYKYETRAR
jgi:prepilin-type N-terminal cleavage/methylation domain-containing protein